MRKSALIHFWILILMGAFLCSPAYSYQEVDVKNGGTIQGNAFLTGPNPPPRIFHLVLFPNLDMCAEVEPDPETATDDSMNRVMFDFIEGENRGLSNVIVSLEKVEAGKPFQKSPVMIRSENCKFYPTVNAIQQGAVFHVDNVDAVMHNSQVYQAERGKIILNIPIPAEQVSDGHVTFQKNYKIMQMICGMHEFMQTWGYRVQNPYYSQTEIDGNYKIDNIPPGEYKVTMALFNEKTFPENQNCRRANH